MNDFKTKTEMKLNNPLTTIKFGCLCWPGVLLTLGIIAIRAFQTNAAPIENWSWLSWIWMLLPSILPFFVWFIIFLVWFVILAFVEICHGMSR